MAFSSICVTSLRCIVLTTSGCASAGSGTASTLSARGKRCRSMQIDAPVGDDTEQPCRELRAPVLPFPAMRPHLEQGILDDIFRISTTADDAKGNRERAIDMTFDQKSECSFVI